MLPRIYNRRMSCSAPGAMFWRCGLTAAQHSSQVLMFEGKSCSHFRAFTNYLLCCRGCQAPWRMFFSSLLDAVALGLDGSGAFLWCGDLASRTTVSPCGFSRPSPVSRGVWSAMSNLRLSLALRVRSPPWMPLEDAIDRTTRGQ